MYQQVKPSITRKEEPTADDTLEYYHFLAAVTHQERYRRHGRKDAADPTGFVQ
jgi:hypothetical protein